MCMEDVRIARSQRVRSNTGLSTTGVNQVDYDVYPRRIRVVITGKAPRLVGTVEDYVLPPTVLISTDSTFGDDTKLLVKQTLFAPFVFDAETFGEVVQGPFSVQLTFDDARQAAAIAEIELVAKPSEDVPLLQY